MVSVAEKEKVYRLEQKIGKLGSGEERKKGFEYSN